MRCLKARAVAVRGVALVSCEDDKILGHVGGGGASKENNLSDTTQHFLKASLLPDSPSPLKRRQMPPNMGHKGLDRDTLGVGQ